jgi:zinc protease
VVGAIDAETLKTQLDRLFGALPEKQVLTPVADVEPRLGEEMQVVYDQPQTSLQLAYPGMKRADPGFYAAALMNEILGGGTFTSRLFKEVREKRGLAYGVDSALVNRKHASSLVIGTATRSDRAEETLGVIRDVVKGMAEGGPTEQELAAAKKYVIGSYAINNLDSSGAIAGTLLELQLQGLGIDYMERRTDYLGAVTLGEVKAVATKLLSAKPAIMVVGPALKDKDAGGGKG